MLLTFINSSNTFVPSFGDDSTIGIFLSAATGAIDTASAKPVTPFTTAISETLPNLFATSNAVVYLVSPLILSTLRFIAFNSDTTFFDTTPVPPITYTFFAPNRVISFLVSLFKFSAPVRSIGAFFILAKGVALSASTIALEFTITTLSDLLHPLLLTFIAVLYLSSPISLFSFADITGFFTVTLHVATLAPSFVFTVIIALPVDIAFTFPVVSTVATFVLLLVHSTFLFVALLGLIVATKLSLAPVTKFSAVLFKVTPVTDITGFFTVTLHVATLINNFCDAVGLIATYALLLLILKSSLLKFSSDTFNPSCTHLSPLIFLTIEQPFTLST